MTKKERIAELEQKIIELEQRIAMLEARPKPKRIIWTENTGWLVPPYLRTINEDLTLTY